MSNSELTRANRDLNKRTDAENDEDVLIVAAGDGAGLIGGLADRCGSLSLSGDLEAGGFKLSGSSDVVEGSRGSSSLNLQGCFGIYVTVRRVRDFNPKTLEKTMKNAWSPIGSMEMTIVGENFFLFKFSRRQDFSKVLREGPWRFDDHPLGIAEAKPGVRVTKELLIWVPYWIQVYNIPPLHHSQETTEKVAALISKNFIAVDATVRRQQGVAASFVRVRVPINTAVRLPRGTSVWFGEEETPLAFKFERLLKFCYVCGLVDHEMADCEGPYPENFDPEDPLYGDWLRGIPPRIPTWQQQGTGGSAGKNPFMVAQQSSRRAPVGPPPAIPRITAWSDPPRIAAPPGFEIPQFSMGWMNGQQQKKANGRSVRARTNEVLGQQDKKRPADAMETSPSNEEKDVPPFSSAT